MIEWSVIWWDIWVEKQNDISPVVGISIESAILLCFLVGCASRFGYKWTNEIQLGGLYSKTLITNSTRMDITYTCTHTHTLLGHILFQCYLVETVPNKLLFSLSPSLFFVSISFIHSIRTYDIMDLVRHWTATVEAATLMVLSVGPTHSFIWIYYLSFLSDRTEHIHIHTHMIREYNST